MPVVSMFLLVKLLSRRLKRYARKKGGRLGIPLFVLGRTNSSHYQWHKIYGSIIIITTTGNPIKFLVDHGLNCSLPVVKKCCLLKSLYHQSQWIVIVRTIFLTVCINSVTCTILRVQVRKIQISDQISFIYALTLVLYFTLMDILTSSIC